MYTIEEFDKGKIKVLKYILYKKRTENEVRSKFQKIMENDLLEDIIEYLKETKYINDNEYIEKAIHDFIVLKNLSIREIQYKLIQKGLARNQIEDYINQNLEELQEYEIKSAKKIISKKIISMEIDEVKQFLLRKGYKLTNIEKAIQEGE